MKRIIGMSVAAVAVMLQLAGFAAGFASWRTEPAIYLTPIEAPEVPSAHHA